MRYVCVKKKVRKRALHTSLFIYKTITQPYVYSLPFFPHSQCINSTHNFITITLIYNLHEKEREKKRWREKFIGWRAFWEIFLKIHIENCFLRIVKIFHLRVKRLQKIFARKLSGFGILIFFFAKKIDVGFYVGGFGEARWIINIF